MEKETHHYQFLKTKTRCQLTGASVWVGIESKLGGLVEFSSSNQIWTSLVVSPKFNVNNKSKGVAKPSDNLMVGVILIFMAPL